MTEDKVPTNDNVQTTQNVVTEKPKAKKLPRPEAFIAHINSATRLAGSTNDFLYFIDLPANMNYSRCVVSNLAMIKSYFAIDTPYNTFDVVENGVTRTITLPRGNYNSSSITTQTALALNGVGKPVGWDYTCVFPNDRTEPQTGKLTFAVTGNSGVQPEFIFNALSAYEFLGFRRNTTYTFSTDLLTSEDPIILGGETCLYLRSDMVDNPKDNILQEIYTGGVEPFGVIIFSQIDYRAASRVFTKGNKNMFKFAFTDEFGTAIDLNNIEFQFTLIIF